MGVFVVASRRLTSVVGQKVWRPLSTQLCTTCMSVCVFVSWWQFGGAFYFRFRYRTISSTRLHRCRRRRCCRRAFVYCIYVVYCITQNAKQINKRADKVPPTNELMCNQADHDLFAVLRIELMENVDVVE